MNNLPGFSKLDADLILRRAAEIEGAEDTRPVSVDEIRSIAAEAGFGRHAVEQAISEAQRVGGARVRRPGVERSGLVITRLTIERDIQIEITSDQLMQVVRLFHPYREGPAQVKLEYDRITWRDRKGIRFSVVSAGGVTEIRAYLAKPLLRKGRWMGWVKTATDRLEDLVLLVASQ
jgi:hypothetical protein